jgi:hypothetical protein
MTHQRPYSLIAGLLFLLSAFYLVPTVTGQSATATLSGSVVDQNGAVIPGAIVTLENTANGLNRKATTNSEGNFTFPLLAPGTFTVRVENQGFAPVEVQNVVLNVGDNKSLQILLKAGNISEMIRITADAPLINQSPAVGTVVDRKFVENLPLNGRTLQSLLTLSPGVTLTNTGSSQVDGGQFSVNGQRATTNYFTIDGVGANFGLNGNVAGGTLPGTNALGATNSLVSVDALQEFRIQTSSYAPEFGRSPGAQVSMITRSGTNDFHGTLFEYVRNDKFDATDWFVNQKGQKKPPLRFNNFGGTFGGPVLFPRFGEGGRQPWYDGHNRTFFFFSYEGQRIRQPQFVITSVPSLAARQTAVSTGARAILNAYPIPNGPSQGNNIAEFDAGFSNPSLTDSTSIRIDQTIGPKVTVFGRVGYAPSETVARAGAGFAASSAVVFDFQTRTLTLGVTHQITPSFVNDLRFNVSDQKVRQSYFMDSFGGAQPISEALLRPTPVSSDSAVTITVTDFTPSALRVGQFTAFKSRQLNIVDGISYELNQHQLKFGVDYRQFLPEYGGSQGLNYNFTSVANLLSNTTSSGSITVQSRARVALTNFSAYAQDFWKATQRLSLTYGLRYEVNTAPHTRGGPNSYIPLLGDPANPASIQLGTLGAPLWKSNYSNFAPRLGLAYLLRQKSGRELMVRAGAGIFFDTGTGIAALVPFFLSFPNAVTKATAGAAFPLTSAQATMTTPSAPAPGTNFAIFSPNLKLPRTYQWNVALEQSLGSAQALTASYVGAVGRKLLRFDLYPSVTSQAYRVNSTTNFGTSDYHALQIEFQRRLSRGLSSVASYTWSHSIDTSSSDLAAVAPSGFLNVGLDRGPSSFDLRHSFSAAVSYDLPKFASHGWVRALVNHWGVDSILVARSASPVDVTSSRNIGFGTIALRPDLIPGVPLYLADPTVAGGRRFNPAAFTIPMANRQGTLSRNTLRGFPLTQLDFSFRRRFPITERIGLQFRGELFNVFNHPNFGNPIGSLTSAQFGRATSMMNATLGTGGPSGGLSSLFQTGGPRSMQFSLKLTF